MIPMIKCRRLPKNKKQRVDIPSKLVFLTTNRLHSLSYRRRYWPELFPFQLELGTHRLQICHIRANTRSYTTPCMKLQTVKVRTKHIHLLQFIKDCRINLTFKNRETKWWNSIKTVWLWISSLSIQNIVNLTLAIDWIPINPTSAMVRKTFRK